MWAVGNFEICEGVIPGIASGDSAVTSAKVHAAIADGLIDEIVVESNDAMGIDVVVDPVVVDPLTLGTVLMTD